MKKYITRILIFLLISLFLFSASPRAQNTGGRYAGLTLLMKNINGAFINPQMVPMTSVPLLSPGTVEGALDIIPPINPISQTTMTHIAADLAPLPNPSLIQPSMGAPSAAPTLSNAISFQSSPMAALSQPGIGMLFSQGPTFIADVGPSMGDRMALPYMSISFGMQPIMAAAPAQTYPLYMGNAMMGNAGPLYGSDASSVSFPMIYMQNLHNSDFSSFMPPSPGSIQEGHFQSISTSGSFITPPAPLKSGSETLIQNFRGITPEEEFAVEESPILRNLSSPLMRHRNELIVTFRPGTPPTVINDIHRRHGGIVVKVSLYAGFYLIAPSPQSTVEALVQAYSAEKEVLYAEPNYIRRAHLVPNDPYYPYQWYLAGLSTGWAWDVGTGLGAVVGLLDSGVAYRTSGIYAQAPDLAGTFFAPGYDFVNADLFPDDDNSHGTFMCGCIAQTTNNLLGVAGVAFNATIMPVKIMDSAGDVAVADEVEGIYFAVNNGAHVINLSLGGPGIILTEQTAVDFAYNSGVIVIGSAGNLASSTLEYPASYETALSVSATQYDDTLAPYSNYGIAIDICAPGGNLSLDQNFDGWVDGILQQTHDGIDFTAFSYKFVEGTSPACALVSGVAALIVGKATTPLTPLQIRGIIEGSVIDLGTIGWDEYYGWGKVNAYYALLDTP